MEDRDLMKIIEVRKPGEKKGKVRALLLFSGGLDSILAGKLLEEQGVEVVCLTFCSQFFGAEEVRRVADEQGWPLVVVDISQEQIQVVENPRYGYGRNMNPCLDCHGQMVRIAGELLAKYQADFVATGEVVGERLKSQNRQALEIVEKLSGIKGLVLRPLSARLLRTTLPEEKELVERQRLLDISGRSRKRQLELAEKYSLKEYPTPAGGCLLTDPVFSARLKKLQRWRGRLLSEDIELIKTGRVFFEEGGLIVVGRDEQENERIKQKVLGSDVIIVTSGVKGAKGPLTVVRLKSQLEATMKVTGDGDLKWLDEIRDDSLAGREGDISRIQRRGSVTDEAEAGGGLTGLPPVVKKAALLTLRYSQGRHRESGQVVIVWSGRSFRQEFSRPDWEPYL
jgi:tRNA U34 2-thiouridine synthase MnmA/TrmU